MTINYLFVPLSYSWLELTNYFINLESHGAQQNTVIVLSILGGIHNNPENLTSLSHFIPHHVSLWYYHITTPQ